MAKLSDPISILKGVGPARRKLFENLNIFTLRDLLCHFPRGYDDRTKLVTIDCLEPEVPVCFRAMVMGTPRTAHIRKGLDLTKVQVADSTARLNLTFFNQKFAAEQLQYGREFIFCGTLSGDFGGYGMTNPVFERPKDPPVLTRCILPLYPLTAGLSNTVLRRTIRQALALCDPPEEILPEAVRQEYGLLPASQAYAVIHEPRTLQEAEAAKKRMIFEEFFVFSAGLAQLRLARAQERIPVYRELSLEPFEAGLPFRLTGAQRRAIEDIVSDFSKGVPMNRLIQGDVGSGKTMVAAAAAYLAGKNGFQAALMAPTEILAEQHYRALGPLFERFGLKTVLLTGAMTPKEKAKARELLASGAADLAVGTHALLSETTEFGDLGLVITDEQHRFGVAQRAALRAKGHQPHLLVMSATPIPRTLALLMYGDLEVSVVDELPPGREPVDTFLVGEAYRARIHAFIRKQAAEGHQSFVVCPAVEESEELGLKSAILWAETLQKTVFPDLRVSLLHGQMKGAEKERIMWEFAQGQADILVATTVVEVGVDVPNATLMVVEDADRFGLSQLHQLRGRVGRGGSKSYCILVSQNRNPQTRERLKALCRTTDGFAIAKEDLKLRGPGDFFGSRQSGTPVLRAVNLGTELETLEQAQQASDRWMRAPESRTSPEGAALRLRIGELFRRTEGTLN